MGLFNKDMKIGFGEKFDASTVSQEGITEEELATINKKKTKLIDIYKKFDLDGDGSLNKIELAKAMDGFVSAAGNDEKLSGKELDELANDFNQQHDLTGKNAVKGKDMKNFLKSVREFTNKDSKVGTYDVLVADAIDSSAKQQGYNAVPKHEDIYEKDGKYYRASLEDGVVTYKRVKMSENQYVEMTSAEITAEKAQEAEDAYNKKVAEAAKEQGYTKNDNGIYTKDGNLYLFNNDTQKFDRAKLDENGILCVMSAEELQAEKDAQNAAARKAKLAEFTDYTVQNGENFRALIKRSLEAQGIEITEENMNKAIADFKQQNPGKLHGSRGNEYLFAGDVVKVQGGLDDKANADDVKAAYSRAIAAKAKTEAESTPKQDVKTETKTEVKSETKQDTVQKADTKPDVKAEPKGETNETSASNNDKAVRIAGMDFVDGKSKNGYVLNKDGSIQMDLTDHGFYKNIKYSFYDDGSIKQIVLENKYNTSHTVLNYDNKGISRYKSGKMINYEQLKTLGLDINKPSVINQYVAPQESKAKVESKDNSSVVQDTKKADKKAKIEKYPLKERLPNGYTRRDIPGANDGYYDADGNRISPKEYKEARGERSSKIDRMVQNPIKEELSNGYTKRDTGGFTTGYFKPDGTRISKEEFEAEKAKLNAK